AKKLIPVPVSPVRHTGIGSATLFGYQHYIIKFQVPSWIWNLELGTWNLELKKKEGTEIHDKTFYRVRDFRVCNDPIALCRQHGPYQRQHASRHAHGSLFKRRSIRRSIFRRERQSSARIQPSISRLLDGYRAV